MARESSGGDRMVKCASCGFEARMQGPFLPFGWRYVNLAPYCNADWPSVEALAAATKRPQEILNNRKRGYEAREGETQ